VGLRILLVGAGHAHLHVVRHAQALRDAGVTLCLVNPPTFLYSGLATGWLSGELGSEVGQIDVGVLAAAYGVEHHPSVVTGVDRGEHRASLADGTTLSFDIISLNVGSIIADPSALRQEGNVWAAKPLEELVALAQMLRATISKTGLCPNVVIAGSGQTGFEVAAALAGLCERLRVPPRITLVGPTPSASWAPVPAARRLVSSLRDRGVQITGGHVVARGVGACRLASGVTIACDALVLASGLIGPDLIGQLSLPIGSDGRLLVTPELQSIGDPRVFAAGDCAVIEATPRPCAGVFGVRAAPILVRNLIALAMGRRLAAYAPQRRWLSVMDLGNGTGFALRGPWWWFGRGALHLKRWLDLRFIAQARGTSR
jgi:NADH dehydrogenase FAD-containing subunit